MAFFARFFSAAAAAAAGAGGGIYLSIWHNLPVHCWLDFRYTPPSPSTVVELS